MKKVVKGITWRLHYAAFRNKVQVSGWDLRRDKIFSIARGVKRSQGGDVAVTGKWFMDAPKSHALTSAATEEGEAR